MEVPLLCHAFLLPLGVKRRDHLPKLPQDAVNDMGVDEAFATTCQKAIRARVVGWIPVVHFLALLRSIRLWYAARWRQANIPPQ